MNLSDARVDPHHSARRTGSSREPGKTLSLRRRFTVLAFVVHLCGLQLPGCHAAPQGPVELTAAKPDGVLDADMSTVVRRDDEGNVYFDLYAIRGQDNKFMYAKNGVLVVSVQPPADIQNTFEHELWHLVTTTLGVTTADLEILLFPSEPGRRVLLKKGKLSESECQERIKDVLKPYIPSAAQGTSGKTEPPPFLTPYDPLAIYAQNDTNHKEGPLKYYEIAFPKEEKGGKRSEPIPRKRLIEMKPYYGRDPSWMAKILRDLRPNKEVVLRGRLIPANPLRPLIDNYRGPKKVKVARKVLEGIAEGSGVPPAKSKLRFEMSHPVPALMMLDFLSPDKKAVLARRLVSPLFRNDTVDFVEELEYTEVV